MAKATIRTIEEVHKKTEKRQDGVVLHLTDVEARVLRHLLSCVGGRPDTSALCYLESIKRCLGAMGYKCIDDHERERAGLLPVTRGNVYFNSISLKVFDDASSAAKSRAS